MITIFDGHYVIKRAQYLAYGLLESWIVDPWERTVTVLVRDGDSWRERVHRDDQGAEGLALPRFTIRVAELWAAIEGEGEEDENDNDAEDRTG